MDKRRRLYLIAYDVCEPRRLQRICRYLSGYKVAGQKSVCEVWVTAAELAGLHAHLEELMDIDADRVHILALDPRMKPALYGRARTFAEPYFAIV